jgi:transcriptional regulator with XRE-family HTH domain|tara:strand:+ start:10680 stop:10901 length:222 start_codon:yes stop_codon:yes gene_type:complete
MEHPVHWSALLKNMREESGLSQRQLSRKCKVPQRTLAEYENTTNPRHLSIYRVEQILEALGYELEALWINKKC